MDDGLGALTLGIPGSNPVYRVSILLVMDDGLGAKKKFEKGYPIKSQSFL